MNKTMLAAALGLAMSTEAARSAMTMSTGYGRRALVGQYKRLYQDSEGREAMLDLSERINFERSRYIPGNGKHHRLGRRK